VKVKITLAILSLSQLALFLAKLQAFTGFHHGH
jgi:hypothetical protein